MLWTAPIIRGTAITTLKLVIDKESINCAKIFGLIRHTNMYYKYAPTFVILFLFTSYYSLFRLVLLSIQAK